VLVGAAVRPGLPPPAVAARTVEALLRRHHRALTRFDPGSELSRLNRARDEQVAISTVLARAIEGALWAAERSGGLVDPTLLGELERSGYATSRAGVAPVPLARALRAAPARRPARPREGPCWRQVRLRPGNVRRPPGVRLDLGGSAKGGAADEAASALGGYASFVVDAGGDMVIGGAAPALRLVEVAHPLAPDPALSFQLVRGALATSGLATRIWRTANGFAHHLIDPSSGLPAWTGVLQATALAGSALEAEVLAKTAVLSGPTAGMRLLEPLGGALVLDDGEVRAVGALRGTAEAVR
jgi:thiamine biosynthesis lipoprotein